MIKITYTKIIYIKISFTSIIFNVSVINQKDMSFPTNKQKKNEKTDDPPKNQGQRFLLNV